MRWFLVLAAAMRVQAAAARDVDGEGKVAVEDRCPDEPEDLDGYQDEDGCPDRDNDGDGVLDAVRFADGVWISHDCMHENGRQLDCRDRAEDRDGHEDEDGCPEVVCTSTWCPAGFDEVWYDAAERLRPWTRELLDEVADAMNAAPDISMRVEGHADGGRGARGAQLRSERMVAKVVAELVRRGISRARLVPQAYGATRPDGDDRTRDGRARNRRVVVTAICEPPVDRGPPELRPGWQCRR